jgi:hypothetical protein
MPYKVTIYLCLSFLFLASLSFSCKNEAKIAFREHFRVSYFGDDNSLQSTAIFEKGNLTDSLTIWRPDEVWFMDGVMELKDLPMLNPKVLRYESKRIGGFKNKYYFRFREKSSVPFQLDSVFVNKVDSVLLTGNFYRDSMIFVNWAGPDLEPTEKLLLIVVDSKGNSKDQIIPKSKARQIVLPGSMYKDLAPGVGELFMVRRGGYLDDVSKFHQVNREWEYYSKTAKVTIQ